jgi:ankyrin repeat protein
MSKSDEELSRASLKLKIAAQNGDFEILLAATKEELLSYRDEKGFSLLHIATCTNQHNVVHFLIDDVGFDVDLTGGKSNTTTALSLLFQIGNPSKILLDFLIARGADFRRINLNSKKENGNLLYSVISDAITGDLRIFNAAAENIRPLDQELALLPNGLQISPILTIGFIEEGLERNKSPSPNIALFLMRKWHSGCENLQVDVRNAKWQNLLTQAINFGEPRFIQFLILNDERGPDARYLEKELNKNIKYFEEKKLHLIEMCNVFNLVRKIAAEKAATKALDQEQLLFRVVDIAQCASKKLIADIVKIYPNFATTNVKFAETGVVKNVMQIFIECDRGDALEILFQANRQYLYTRIEQETLPVEFCCFPKTGAKYQALQFFARELKEVRFTEDGFSLVYFACTSGPRALKILLQNEIFKREIDAAQGQAKPSLYYVVHDILFGKEAIIFSLFETAKILIENGANIDFIFEAESDFKAFSLQIDFLQSLVESGDTSPLRKKVITNLIDIVEKRRAMNLSATAVEQNAVTSKKKKKKKKAADDLEDVIEKIRQISFAEELDRDALFQQIELAKQNGAVNHLADLLLECAKARKAEALEFLCAQKEILYDRRILLQAIITSGSNNEKPCLLELDKIAIIKAMIQASQTKVIRKAINDCTWGTERKDKMSLISCPVHINQPNLLQFLIEECGVAISGDSGVLTMRAAALQNRKECLRIILDNINFEEFVLGNEAALRVFNDALTSFALIEGEILYFIDSNSIECAQIILDRCSDARQRKIVTQHASELAEVALAQQDGGKALEFLLKNDLNPNPEQPNENYVCSVVRNARGVNLLLLLIAYGADLDCPEVKKMVADDLEKQQPGQEQSEDLIIYREIALKIIIFCQTKQFDTDIEEGVPRIINFVIDRGNAAGFRRLLNGVKINEVQFINFITRALMVGNKEIVRELLQFEKLLKTVINNKVRFYDSKNARETESTLLQIAISCQDTKAVRILLKNKAQLNICDSYGRTAISSACNIRNEEITRLIIKEAAKQKDLCNMRDEVGSYPLQIAVGCKNIAAVKALFEVEDIDIDLGAPIFSAIYLYCQNKDSAEYLEIVNLLLEKGANVNLVSGDEKSPLYFAIASNNGDLVQKILNKISSKPKLFEIKAAIEDPQIDIKILEILLNFGIPYQEFFADGNLLFDVRPDMQEKIALLKAHEEKDKAATKIQAAFKGHLIRKKLKRQKEELQQQENAATKIQATFKGFKQRKITALLREEILKQEEIKKTNAAIKIQAAFKGFLAKKELKRKQEGRVLAQNNRAATKIQAAFKRYRARKQFIATKSAMQLEMQDRQIQRLLQTESKIQSIAYMPEFLQEKIMDLVRKDKAIVLIKGSAIHKKSPKDLDLEIFIPDIASLTDEEIEELIKEKLGLEVKVSTFRSYNNFTANFKCGLLDVSIYDSKFPPNENYRWTSSFDAIRLQFDESGAARTLVTEGCKKRCADIGETNPFDNFVVNPCSRDRFLRACLFLTKGLVEELQVFAGFDKVVENANYWQNAFDSGDMKKLDAKNIMNCNSGQVIEPDFVGKCVSYKIGAVATNAAVSILQKFGCLDNHCNLLRKPNEKSRLELENGLMKFCQDHDLNGELRKKFFGNLQSLMERYKEINPKNLHPNILRQQEDFYALLDCAHIAAENCFKQSTEVQEDSSQHKPSASAINLEARQAKKLAPLAQALQ